MAELTFAGVTFRYQDQRSVALDVPYLSIGAGEFVVAVGASGSGKSTLLRSINGIVPHLTGGTFAGEITIDGRSTRHNPPRLFADTVGFVHQDPEAQFVVDHVESDIAFALENLKHDTTSMRRRVEEVLDALAIAHLRDRSPATLSGGERQRVAIAGALAAGPSILVLDEPTSQLDPQGAEDVLAALQRLNEDHGTSIVLAEHRLDRAAPLADRVIIMDAGAVQADGEPAVTLAHYVGAPTVTQLGRALGWSPAPLTVKKARTYANGYTTAMPTAIEGEIGAPILIARDIELRYFDKMVLQVGEFSLAHGEVVALLGRNGSGKSTLLQALSGLHQPHKGSIERKGRVAYVPQDSSPLFSMGSVSGDVRETLRLLGHSAKNPDTEHAVTSWLQHLGLTELAHRNPRTLSGGERQRLAIAIVAVGGAQTLLLDEPTRGMDAPSRAALEQAVREHAKGGGAVVLATHDVELAARVASRVVVLGDRDVVADGPARSVLSGSLFAPQTLRVLPPLLTVDEAVKWALRS